MGAGLGEVIDLGTGAGMASGGGLGLVFSLVALAALGVYALLQEDTGNDDDDSTPGGGLMQPVGSAA
ncbi:MAG: hypothetical protein RLZZ533_1387 [Cyanobacteriota bacterium]|jgi:hypothetical protein